MENYANLTNEDKGKATSTDTNNHGEEVNPINLITTLTDLLPNILSSNSFSNKETKTDLNLKDLISQSEIFFIDQWLL